MIFVTLGSQKFQFNRLLKKIDEMIENGTLTEEVFAQIGASDYRPKHYEYVDFMSSDDFLEMEAKTDILITHGGTGTIISAIKKGKKVIAVPRLSKYGEHVDDHQLQLISQFDKMNIICACNEVEFLPRAIEEVNLKKYNQYQSNSTAIIESIENFLKI